MATRNKELDTLLDIIGTEIERWSEANISGDHVKGTDTVRSLNKHLTQVLKDFPIADSQKEQFINAFVETFSTGLDRTEQEILSSSAFLQQAGLTTEQAMDLAIAGRKALVFKKGIEQTPEAEETISGLFKRNGLSQKDATKAYSEFTAKVYEYMDSSKYENLIASDILFEVLEAWRDRLRVNTKAYKKLGYIVPSNADISHLYSIEYALWKTLQAEEKARKAEERAKKAEKQARALQKKTSIFKVGKHLAEQSLKRRQPDLFEEPLSNVETISQSEQVYLDLNAEEHLLVISLSKLLHLHSQTDNPEAPDYYLGNREVIPEEHRKSAWTTKPVIIEDPTVKLPVPQLMVSTYEIAREYVGGSNPSGTDQRTVDRLLQDLAKRSFRYKYKRTFQGTGRKGKVTTETHTVDTTQPLIHLWNIEQERSEQGGATVKRNAKIITLNPIYIDQIGNVALIFPEDYIKRLRGAWPTKRMPAALPLLANYLNGIRAGQKGTKVKPHRIYVSKLANKLEPKKYKKDKKTAIEKVEKCLDTCHSIGLIEGWYKEPGATAEQMYHIQIAKKWE